MHLVDYFYEILAFEPFSTYMANENSARNLAIFSQLITIFQNYYHIDFVRQNNRKDIPIKLIGFLRLLLRSGINEYEDPDNPIPKGHVQIMTVHQSKGLEFPVVVVGTYGDIIKDQARIDNNLCQYYHRSQFEPADRIATFDKMRQYYVAFSRAEKLLVIANGSSNYTRNSVSRLISPVCSSLNQWQIITTTAEFSKLRILAKKPFIPKKSFSFTSHIITSLKHVRVNISYIKSTNFLPRILPR
jgi:DNA helicase II / ATP-dependent DNA helicase PcrA